MTARRRGRKALWMDQETLDTYSFFRSNPTMAEIVKSLRDMPEEKQERMRAKYAEYIFNQKHVSGTA